MILTPNKLFFLICFFILAILPSGKLLAWGNDSLVPAGENSLEMRGHILISQGQARENEKIPLDSAQVSVISEAGKLLWRGITDSKGRLNIKLPLGRKFTMSFTKMGYVKKLINIDTHVSNDNKKDFSFSYEIDIFESIVGLDVSVLNEPVARISFSEMAKDFNYDIVYTTKVNSGLQKMYREYYELKRKAKLTPADTTLPKSIPAKSKGIKK
ncbi:MAG: hypothetical protein NT084_10695 [Bacteroidetes bacterium]|jgi:hypothetical protein|nr:hypothetical protein [Bacteroidota bacterium]